MNYGAVQNNVNDITKKGKSDTCMHIQTHIGKHVQTYRDMLGYIKT